MCEGWDNKVISVHVLEKVRKSDLVTFKCIFPFSSRVVIVCPTTSSIGSGGKPARDNVLFTTVKSVH